MINNIAVIAILAGLLLFAGFKLNEVSGQKAVYQAEVKNLTEALDQALVREENNRKVLVARQAEIASQGVKLAQTQQALSQALQGNSQWSNINVPKDVQNSLWWGSTSFSGQSPKQTGPAIPAQPAPATDSLPNFSNAGGDGGN